MRSSNSIKNAIVAIGMNLIVMLVGFIAQKIFIVTLGNEYLGLNGLFSNILSMLSIVELGFGNAIIYHLYKPVADNDERKIAILISFYKRVYSIIAIIIFILGLAIMPFLTYIVGEVSIEGSIHFLFLLALLDIVASYLLTYKRSTLYANQKNYIINIIHILYTISMNVCEIVLLLLFKNYVLYLIIKILFRILENIIINIIVNKMYPFLKKKTNETLDNETKDDIYTKVKGLLFHQIGSSLVLSTDNIIISKFLGVVTVGLYSNYNMIISAITNLLGQVFTSITSVVGNLLIEKNKEKSYKIYNSMLFINSWLYCFCGACLLCLMQPFITLWIGQDYLLSYGVLIALVVNFYIQGMRKTSNTFKEAAGIFYEDRFVPLIESAINIIASIILVKILGLIGVFIGTILSSLILFLYSYPIFVYKRLFNKKYSDFIKNHLKYLIISIFTVVITALVINQINISNLFITLLVNAIICCIVPNLIYILLFFRTEEFKYYLNLLKQLLCKKIKRFN